jgi:hypothetical protein
MLTLCNSDDVQTIEGTCSTSEPVPLRLPDLDILLGLALKEVLRLHAQIAG